MQLHSQSHCLQGFVTAYLLFNALSPIFYEPARSIRFKNFLLNKIFPSVLTHLWTLVLAFGVLS